MFRWLSSATIDEGTGKIVLTLDQSLKPHLIQLKRVLHNDEYHLYAPDEEPV